MPLTSQVAIVTGAGRGIGLACIRSLARDGASVVVATPEDDERSAAVAELETNGHAVLATSTDVTSESDLAEMVAATLDHFGRIDILVNNAGIIGPTAPVQDVERDDWEAVMDVNVTGVYLACKAVLPHLLERGSGRIINIASVAGKIGFPLRSPYAASKWAVIGLTKTLAVEVGSAGILVNAVCPGPIDGPRMDAIIQAKADTIGQPAQQVRDQLERDTLLGRLIPAEHIADMVAFLASDRAASITGQTLDVNAGHLV
ncbi:MAG TPA: short-chain dehydrogenase [Planctomycetaceae bacterium]|nr:short-chain dehydrogenase [Planctomycetaceae bacterium]|tara:strand:- start:1026 stop:1802 length:777 start_codon:yes stop_codon:yes gene_type:complete